LNAALVGAAIPTWSAAIRRMTVVATEPFRVRQMMESVAMRTNMVWH
jgi:hypothetical protein